MNDPNCIPVSQTTCNPPGTIGSGIGKLLESRNRWRQLALDAIAKAEKYKSALLYYDIGWQHDETIKQLRATATELEASREDQR